MAQNNATAENEYGSTVNNVWMPAGNPRIGRTAFVTGLRADNLPNGQNY